ncbi:MAG TPA: hypothetical protein VH986_08015 [Acidimicrobiia bacterium]
MPVPLDEFPVHQVPLSMRYMDSSDRNSYDRSYWNAHDRTGEVFLVTGLGVYPNLGVIDAYATVVTPGRQVSVRMSDALGDDRRVQEVGPYRVEVVEPLSKLRLTCDAEAQGITFDATFTGSFPSLDEPRHQTRAGDRILLDAARFAQVGTWEGWLKVDDREWELSPEVWVGSRDRSWGIRPVGEQPGPGRPDETPGGRSFWWLYAPTRFDDFFLFLIAQEDGDGNRGINEAVRVWPDGRVEQLGWPEVEIQYRSGTRHPERAVVHLRDRHHKPFDVEFETLGFAALHLGAGYGGDDWSHGRWMGRDWVDRVSYDLTDPGVAARIPFGIIDHVGKATCDGAEGYGLFEHTNVGRHAPSGFADFGAVAP